LRKLCTKLMKNQTKGQATSKRLNRVAIWTALVSQRYENLAGLHQAERRKTS
jgi:hypothetical protein